MAWTYKSNTYEGRYLQLDITETVHKDLNSSTLNWTLSSVGGNTSYYAVGETTITINGVRVYHNDAMGWSKKVFPVAKGKVSDSLEIKHNADGTKPNVYISFKTRVYISESLEYADEYINLTPIDTYLLSISAGTGSSITVNRTYSGYAKTGNLSNGTRLYYGDKLKITFAPSTNYAINEHTVNNVTFNSGNTHTVTGNTTVKATAQVLASSVGVTNADIGSVSTITVMKYDSSYVHSLQYSFGSLSGYITNTGEIVETETKFSATNIAFTIPTSFYAQIPNAKTGKCIITCRTYSSVASTSLLGEAKTCTFVVTATGSPVLDGTVEDINETTIALTGDSSKLIRYKSTAKATISATAQHESTIVSKSINGTAVSDNILTVENVSDTTFLFAATDSRGYTSTKSINPTIIEYIPLTLNAVLSRPAPTTGEVVLSFNGNFFNNTFGAVQNTLIISYRYRETDAAIWSDWIDIAASNYTKGSASYFTSLSISLGNGFNYLKSYVIQVRATDGTSENVLSTVTSEQTIYKGYPIFDWGEGDFKFNVPVYDKDGNIIDATRNPVELPSNTDTDTITVAGIYYQLSTDIVSNISNVPEAHPFFLFVYSASGFIMQKIIYLESGHEYVRYCVNPESGQVWGTWVRQDGLQVEQPTLPLSIANGGTGASDRATASKNLIYGNNWGGILTDTAQNISKQALIYGYYDSSFEVSTYKPTSWGFALSIGNNAADWHQIWMEQSNNGGGLFHRGGNASILPSNVGWTRILDERHMKRANVTFDTNGIGTMSCSGVKTTSAIFAMRNSSHSAGASNIYPIAEAWCDTDGTVTLMLSNPMSGTFPVSVFWSK